MGVLVVGLGLKQEAVLVQAHRHAVSCAEGELPSRCLLHGHERCVRLVRFFPQILQRVDPAEPGQDVHCSRKALSGSLKHIDGLGILPPIAERQRCVNIAGFILQILRRRQERLCEAQRVV
eukprot:scaffold172_cov254-Pinguiococcus_pyrenoidosus.AAC.16